MIKELLIYKIVHNFVDIHGHFYIEVSNIKGVNCLFVSHDRSENFVRLTCDLESKTPPDTSVAFHPLVPGIIYANLKKGKRTYTHISMNYGKNFSAMKLEKKNGLCDGGYCNIKLNLPSVIQRNLYFQSKWISAFDIVDYSTGKVIERYLISFDGGQNWKLVPFSYFHVQALNQGGIVFGFDPKTKKIVYSFDEGKTYYHKTIYGSNEFGLTSTHTGKFENSRYIILARDKLNNDLLITRIDFPHIFS
ncbi:hypothetical protein RF11_09673 [Thelohanellus kitauei]|uniref:Sortilin N-terminal domain-containing protein n=1 Tax=Thelohanellus kitauei TaxID=669202 RepID=A0A0C2MSZ3_THEKT|nr:hypothetical protein RF11_09673 [Thelohanellus kitauei]